MVIWRDIEGFEGIYQVSNTGLVRSLDRKIVYKNGHTVNVKGKELKHKITKGGYHRVSLSKNNKWKEYLVHRLVASAFIPNEDNLPQINHKDQNTHNNEVSNLEWCTMEYNLNYGDRGSKISEATLGSKKTKPVICEDLNLRFDSVREAARELKISMHGIYSACNGGYKTYNNMRWRYDV